VAEGRPIERHAEGRTSGEPNVEDGHLVERRLKLIDAVGGAGGPAGDDAPDFVEADDLEGCERFVGHFLWISHDRTVHR